MRERNMYASDPNADVLEMLAQGVQKQAGFFRAPRHGLRNIAAFISICS